CYRVGCFMPVPNQVVPNASQLLDRSKIRGVVDGADGLAAGAVEQDVAVVPSEEIRVRHRVFAPGNGVFGTCLPEVLIKLLQGFLSFSLGPALGASVKSRRGVAASPYAYPPRTFPRNLLLRSHLKSS